MDANSSSFTSMLKASKCKLTQAQEHQLYQDIMAATIKAENTPVWQIIDLLYHGFCQLPNLRAIKFVHDSIGRSGWFSEYPILSAAYERYYTLHDRLILHWRKHIVVAGYVNWTDIHVIVCAVKSSGARIQKFAIYEKAENGTADTRMTPYVQTDFCILQSTNWIPYKKFFSNLTSLSLVVSTTFGSWHSLPELLCAATLLEHLSIDCQRREKYATGFAGYHFQSDAIACAFLLMQNVEKHKIYNPVRAVVLPKLRTLSLSNLTTDGWGLNKVLKYHTKTLKSLMLQNVNHPSRSSPEMWEAILDTIKSMDLNSVTLENVSGFVREVSDLERVPSESQIRLNGDIADTPNTPDMLNQHARRIWDATHFWVGKMPQDVRRNELITTGTHIDTYKIFKQLRDHICRDQRKLDPLIMAYIDGKLELNPLLGLTMHHQIDWDIMDAKWTGGI